MRFWGFILLIGGVFSACQSSNFNEKNTDIQQKIYRQAIQNGDTRAATQAVYHILAASPNESHWEDSLALLYVQQQAFLQAIKVAEKRLNTQPKNTLLLKVQALSHKSIGQQKAALAAYEKLFVETQDIYHLYEIASLQYSMMRLAECLRTANAIQQHPDLKSAKISLAFNEQNQLIPLSAAVLNIKGVVAKDLNKRSEAQQLFEMALQIYPDFALAKGNLAEMKQQRN